MVWRVQIGSVILNGLKRLLSVDLHLVVLIVVVVLIDQNLVQDIHVTCKYISVLDFSLVLFVMLLMLRSEYVWFILELTIGYFS
jgi:hypothetical protein